MTRAAGFLIAVWLGALGCSTSRAIDASVDDAPRGDVDPVGSWESCDATWVFTGDRHVERIDHRMGCVGQGTWSTSGSALTIEWDESCGVYTHLAFGAQAIRTPTTLTIHRDGEPSAFTYTLSGTTEVAELTVADDADPTRRTVLRVLHGPTDGSGCYWAEDGACGGLFSCSGRILQWRTGDDGAVLASTACTGDCPCGGILELSPTSTGYGVAFRGINCEGNYEGTATATRE